MAFTAINKPSVHFDCPIWDGSDSTTQLSYANQTDSVNATQLVKTGKWYWEVKSETDATNESYCMF